MKRFPRDWCNLESRMRKQARLDLEASIQREEERKKQVALKVKCDQRGNPLMNKECLPWTVMHVGGEIYISIVYFLEQTRVHIRRFTCDDEGFLHPTKDGVSLPMTVWYSFQEKIWGFKTDLLVVEKDLCVSEEKKDGESVFLFQRMFQWKNLRFQFMPERVILSVTQLRNLKEYIPEICSKVKEHLIRCTLEHFVLEEEKKSPVSSSDSQIYCDYCDLTELTDSLSKCLTTAISLKISEIFKCFACDDNWPKSDLHSCVLTCREAKYEQYFELAFYKLDWAEIAKDFYSENCNKFVCSVSEFFEELDVNVLFQNIKKMYTAEEEENFV